MRFQIHFITLRTLTFMFMFGISCDTLSYASITRRVTGRLVKLRLVLSNSSILNFRMIVSPRSVAENVFITWKFETLGHLWLGQRKKQLGRNNFLRKIILRCSWICYGILSSLTGLKNVACILNATLFKTCALRKQLPFC